MPCSPFLPPGSVAQKRSLTFRSTSLERKLAGCACLRKVLSVNQCHCFLPACPLLIEGYCSIVRLQAYLSQCLCQFPAPARRVLPAAPQNKLHFGGLQDLMQSPSAFQLSVYISLHLEEGKPTLGFPSSKPSSLPSQKILLDQKNRSIYIYISILKTNKRTAKTHTRKRLILQI